MLNHCYYLPISFTNHLYLYSYIYSLAMHLRYSSAPLVNPQCECVCACVCVRPCVCVCMRWLLQWSCLFFTLWLWGLLRINLRIWYIWSYLDKHFIYCALFFFFSNFWPIFEVYWVLELQCSNYWWASLWRRHLHLIIICCVHCMTYVVDTSKYVILLVWDDFVISSSTYV